MNVFIDIETIPAQDPAVFASIRKSVSENFKAPSTLTKEQAAADLGITDPNEIKFTSKDTMMVQWAHRFKDEKIEEVALEQWRKTSFDGSCGQIAVIGVAIDDDEPQTFYSQDWAAHERNLIASFFDYISTAYNPSSDRRPLFVGHYVADFDLRFMFQRAVILGIKPPAVIPFQAKAWSDHIFDTMLQWAGPKGTIKLDKLCAALGIAGKDGIDGSMVWDLVRDGRIDEVAKYCAGDVRMAREAYRRMTFAVAA